MSKENTQNIITDGINALYSHGLAHAHEMLTGQSGPLIPAVLVWGENGEKKVHVCMSEEPSELGEKICREVISTCSCYVFVYTAIAADQQTAVILKIFDVGSEYLVDLAVPFTEKEGEYSFSSPAVFNYIKNDQYQSENA